MSNAGENFENPLSDTTSPSTTEAKSTLQHQLEQHQQDLLLQKQHQHKQLELSRPPLSPLTQDNFSEDLQENNKCFYDKTELDDKNNGNFFKQ